MRWRSAARTSSSALPRPVPSARPMASCKAPGRSAWSRRSGPASHCGAGSAQGRTSARSPRAIGATRAATLVTGEGCRQGRVATWQHPPQNVAQAAEKRLSGVASDVLSHYGRLHWMGAWKPGELFVSKRFGWALASAMLMGSIGSAHAADMAVKAPPIAPVAAISWTGIYVGGNVGGGWADTYWGSNYNAICSPGFLLPTCDVSERTNSFLGGGQVGARWQTGRFVIGVKGSADFAR